MNSASPMTLGKLRNWTGIIVQASAGLPPVYVMMDHVRASALRGLVTNIGYDTSVLIFIMEASVGLVASIILLGIGRLLLRYWHRGVAIMNATLYGLVVIQGVTIQFAATNLRDCGKTIC